ncbi:MAG: serine/threonine-protein kinase, partial [Planctomycetes bacterium]|nr:serine/threonine-protein kinase [Planctomycetota bacterium]
MINQTISHYRITAKLGQGGMGEVYRATDTKLDRDVAIKVLPDEFADDPKRLARFEREAKALAALHHPNIASIFGFEEHQGKHYLVLELVEGQTLAERLEQGPLEVTEALETCRQIAEAFEAAHDKSIIHRDLKPANVKLSAEGQVKVLDFGLAKTLPPTGSGAGVSANLADSPTITDNTTLPGTILGTAAYMSPEQARGRPVDQRCDIWSLGCVLFECLTGKRACPGEDVTETLAAVLRGEPQWSALPQDTPPTIQLLLRKCLAKDRKRRLHAIADARIDLEQALDDPSASVLRLSDAALQETSAGGGQRHLATGGLVLIVALVTAVLVWILKPTPPAPTPQPPPIRRLSVDLGAEGSLFVRHGTAIRLSPDGSTLAYIARSQDGTGPPQLYLRRLDQLEATPLSAAAGAEQFCFSPDGQWIAFRVVNSDTLQKVSVTGGSAMTLCDSGPTRGIDWSTDGWIVFASPEHRGLSRVSAAGGTPEPLTSLAEEENTQRWPQILPGGGAVLYSAVTRGPEADGSSIMVQKLPTGKPERLRQGGFHARYLASGHLVYLQGGTLFAAAFDLDTLTLQGQPAPVLEEVAANNIG